MNLNNREDAYLFYLPTYFIILRRINDLILEISKKTFTDAYFLSMQVSELCVEVERLFPLNKKGDKLKINSGIFRLKGYIKKVDIIKEHNKILDKYSDVIFNIKRIRNYLQHQPHNIWWYDYSESGHHNPWSEIHFIYKVEPINLKSNSKEEKRTFYVEKFVNLLIELNEIYILIQEEFEEIATKEENRFKTMLDATVIGIDLHGYISKLRKRLKEF